MALSTTRGAVSPSATKVQLPSNYISYYDFTSQYIPDTHNSLAARYGNQSVAGMLYMLAAEEPLTADKAIWSEEGRLHTLYNDVTRSSNTFTKAGHVFRVGELVHVSDASAKAVGRVASVTADTFVMESYKIGGWGSLGTTAISAFVIGSEFRKGTAGMEGSLEKDFQVFENKPVNIKDYYEVSGSDMTNVGWIEVDGGYYWYLASEYDTRRRWEDRMEMQMLLAETADAGSAAEVSGHQGTEGLFQAMDNRSNLYSGVPTTIADWDTIVKQLDKEGKIRENMYYCDRAASLATDDMLGTLNAGYDGGVSYGTFGNREQAIDLGFKGFTRGTYDFYKTDWKLLNDPTLLGGVAEGAGKVRAIMFPVGTTEVYDGNGTDGKKIEVPFLHLKYKVSPAENRKYKTWVTGSVGGVRTNKNDAMEVNHLSERLLCAVAANNFFKFEGA